MAFGPWLSGRWLSPEGAIIYNVLTVDRKDFDRYRSPRGKQLKRLWLKD